MPMSMMSPAGYNEDGSLAEITKTKTLGTGPYMYDGQKENETYGSTAQLLRQALSNHPSGRKP